MHIRSLKIMGLYGHYNKELKFPSDSVLLVGINGSGKTTILNLIKWLLEPSIADLSCTQFDSIELELYYSNKQYMISCNHDGDMLHYNLKVDGIVFHPLSVRLDELPPRYNNDYRLKTKIRKRFENLTPDENELDTWNQLKTLPQLEFLNVNRLSLNQLDVETKDRTNSYEKSSIAVVSKLIQDTFIRCDNIVHGLTEEMKFKLMMLAFDSLFDDSYSSDKRISSPTIKDIEGVKSRVVNLFLTEKANSDDLKTVEKYFDTLKAIKKSKDETKDNIDARVKYLLNVNQYDKVTKMLQEFENLEEKKKVAMKGINDFLFIINSYLEDSYKELCFNNETSVLQCNIKDFNGNIIEEGIDVRFLSSGEQQLIILFGTLMFSQKDDTIYIIDEPELSLHVKWQESLFDHLKQIRSKDNQLIVATHSPIFAEKNRKNAVILYPY